MKSLLNTAVSTMLFLVALFGVASLAQAQTPAPAPLPGEFYAIGGSYNSSSGSDSPVAITAVIAHCVSDGTCPFALYDAVPNKSGPFSVNNNVSVGVAQKLFDLNLLGRNFHVYGTTGAGPSWQGPNLGWSYHFGATVPFKIGKSNFYVLPTLRTQSSSVSGGSGLQLIGGVEIAFGK